MSLIRQIVGCGACVSLLLLDAACARRVADGGMSATIEPAPRRESVDFAADVLAAARAYSTWKRVSDRANWAPTDCRINPPTGVQVSASADDDTHGRKLYFLFAADAEAYERISFAADEPSRRSPVGQVLVKQSWKPAATEAPQPDPSADSFHRAIPAEYVERDGQWFKTGEPMGLFVMRKYAADTPGTDNGWVYATVSADGAQVLEVGRIASCMRCHETAANDRLYGQPRGRDRAVATP